MLHLADEIGLDWPLDDSVSNEEIMALLYPERPDAVNPRKEPDYSYIHRELAKPGVNLTIILKGASGNGKTYLACALGHAACRKFKSVKYIRMPELLDELSIAKGCGTFKKAIKSYKKVDLLILDEWMIRPLAAQEAYDLLEIVESRCEAGSIIFCTQYESAEWYDRINPDHAYILSEMLINTFPS